MLILEMHRKSLLKYMLENFEKLQSLNLFSDYLLIVLFVFVKRILSRSHPNLKSNNLSQCLQKFFPLIGHFVV